MSPDECHPAALATEKLLDDCHVRRGRRSGPGGQHRNKVETAVVITHGPTGVIGSASERRSQHQNHTMAVYRLRVNLAVEVRRPRGPHDDPSPLWTKRCRGGRISVSPTHEDFPALLAEALDLLVAHEMNVRSAAEKLNCTATQLVKLLKMEPRALEQVNDDRRGRGLPPLK